MAKYLRLHAKLFILIYNVCSSCDMSAPCLLSNLTNLTLETTYWKNKWNDKKNPVDLLHLLRVQSYDSVFNNKLTASEFQSGIPSSLERAWGRVCELSAERGATPTICMQLVQKGESTWKRNWKKKKSLKLELIEGLGSVTSYVLRYTAMPDNC